MVGFPQVLECAESGADFVLRGKNHDRLHPWELIDEEVLGLAQKCIQRLGDLGFNSTR